MTSRFYRVKCRDCSFEKVRRSESDAEHQYKTHKGQTGHIITVKGPFYEAKGSETWGCVVCGFKDSYPEPVLEHIREEHEPEAVYLKKGGMDE